MRNLRFLPAAAVGLTLTLGGCISVKTPEKPIEINLNVVIRQEVVVKLQRDVENLIQSNPGAFPGTTPATPPTPR
jgi:YnbE-like lipoprotein